MARFDCLSLQGHPGITKVSHALATQDVRSRSNTWDAFRVRRDSGSLRECFSKLTHDPWKTLVSTTSRPALHGY